MEIIVNKPIQHLVYKVFKVPYKTTENIIEDCIISKIIKDLTPPMRDRFSINLSKTEPHIMIKHIGGFDFIPIKNITEIKYY
jgi:hypothetical protein